MGRLAILLVAAFAWVCINADDINYVLVDGETAFSRTTASLPEIARKTTSEQTIKALRTLLDFGHDVDERDALNRTALHHLVMHDTNNVNTLKGLDMLLERGADVNARDARLSTPLLYALQTCEAGLVGEIVWRLLEAGAEARAQDKDGCAAIHYATVSRLTTINLIVDRDIDINAQDSFGNTALHYAVLSSPCEEDGPKKLAEHMAKHNDGYTLKESYPCVLFERSLYNVVV